MTGKTGFGVKLVVIDLFNPLFNRLQKSDLVHPISFKKSRLESPGTIFRAFIGIFLTGKDRHPEFDQK